MNEQHGALIDTAYVPGGRSRTSYCPRSELKVRASIPVDSLTTWIDTFWNGAPAGSVITPEMLDDCAVAACITQKTLTPTAILVANIPSPCFLMITVDLLH